MQLKRISVFFILVIIYTIGIRGQKNDPPFLRYMDHPWVDSVMKTLTPDERIAQCIWIAAWSDKGIGHEADIAEKIKKYGIGGLVFFQGTSEKQAELINYYQKISGVPLLIAMDAEWGAGMRLMELEKFPFQMTLGAINNESLIDQLGYSVADQCKKLGIHINLAPVADINNNPLNPVINYRSFGEDPERVAEKALRYMISMQDNGLMSVIKHFPGHGDTDTDSHSDLPVIRHDLQRLDTTEFVPFKKLIDAGAGCVMTAHLNIPALDSTPNLPSSLSAPIIKNLLREKLGFRGLVISDAMNMQGVTKYFGPGEAEAKAFEAGNDVVEFVTDIDAALTAIKKSVAEGRVSQEEADMKCRRVLALKYWAGLYRTPLPIKNEGLSLLVNSGERKALIRELYSGALTLLLNDQNLIPVRNRENLKIATLAVNRREKTSFQTMVSNYLPADHFYTDLSKKNEIEDLLTKLRSYDIVITGIYGLDQRPNRNFGITTQLMDFIDALTQSTRTVITWFGNPYAINRIESLQNSKALLLAYQENGYTEELSAQLIFGAIGAKGSLPVTINEKWPCDFGLITPGNLRLQYGFPESAGVNSGLIESKIDSVVNRGLEVKAFPGCVVMVARRGIVILRKSYGYHTYEARTVVKEDDLYDLASVTKVSATTPALMLLESQGRFSTENRLGDYLPFFRRSDKKDLLMKEILAHQAGLTAWIPFWKNTIKKNGDYRKSIYDFRPSDRHPLEVAEGLFIRDSYSKKIFREIRKSELSEKKYLYSDLGFIITPAIVSTITGERIDRFITKNIYEPLGAFDICYNPWEKYPQDRIVPTEHDSLFRRQLLHGTVHDEGAALLGGISGHAGLFATAGDLMKLLEMYRRMGSYGGEEIIKKAVMEKYTGVQFPENNNRRGLGFDKPLLNNNELSPRDAYPAKGASASGFGHSGYTGTFVWVDPEYEICYLFLSNRVYPTRENNLITNLNIRSGVLQAVYDSIID
ncbi:MAG TPA: glycoside hydrolase family 3 N-terminal domain-containing protein [Bacteroidales bacterium]|nr:glycoside hydrolase family 3 N-terminal domain-containing protein [Bacteroidales bacterium]HPJ60316.1 glycoside hydrolase family 3 N-terminal domain-containing protein [Bacteroidales bacterium]HPR13399.1 glycoside hydrolase family 3 N-terminal domain-containing protein [Bacteroidales bacterium]HRW86417.1 glycoside hydrolase family 3 N-terminal domain-containing protein [Bacteroidales bacterium]